MSRYASLGVCIRWYMSRYASLGVYIGVYVPVCLPGCTMVGIHRYTSPGVPWWYIHPGIPPGYERRVYTRVYHQVRKEGYTPGYTTRLGESGTYPGIPPG